MSVLVSPSRTVHRRREFMRAAVLRGPGRFEVVQTVVPKPAEHEVCVQIEGCGICGSNLPVWEGREWFTYPFEAGAPGHEAWGTVDRIGPGVSNLREGDRVALLSYHGFAEYDLADASVVVPLPDGVSQFPGEPLGCVMNIWRRC